MALRRILQIEDVRAVQVGSDQVTYQFNYSNETYPNLPHLLSITPATAC